MLIRFTSTTLFATLITAALAGGCTVSTTSDDDDTATLTVVNDETFAITDLYIGPDDGTYVTTDNLLGDVPLENGDTITISVTCDTYDVEIIDETGTDCYVAGYNLCGTDDEWDLDDAFFATCADSPRTSTTKPIRTLAMPTVNRSTK
jgi:hypothetical protein